MNSWFKNTSLWISKNVFFGWLEGDGGPCCFGYKFIMTYHNKSVFEQFCAGSQDEPKLALLQIKKLKIFYRNGIFSNFFNSKHNFLNSNCKFSNSRTQYSLIKMQFCEYWGQLSPLPILRSSSNFVFKPNTLQSLT